MTGAGTTGGAHELTTRPNACSGALTPTQDDRPDPLRTITRFRGAAELPPDTARGRHRVTTPDRSSIGLRTAHSTIGSIRERRGVTPGEARHRSFGSMAPERARDGRWCLRRQRGEAHVLGVRRSERRCSGRRNLPLRARTPVVAGQPTSHRTTRSRSRRRAAAGLNEVVTTSRPSDMLATDDSGAQPRGDSSIMVTESQALQ